MQHSCDVCLALYVYNQQNYQGLIQWRLRHQTLTDLPYGLNDSALISYVVSRLWQFKASDNKSPSIITANYPIQRETKNFRNEKHVIKLLAKKVVKALLPHIFDTCPQSTRMFITIIPTVIVQKKKLVFPTLLWESYSNFRF